MDKPPFDDTQENSRLARRTERLADYTYRLDSEQGSVYFGAAP